MVSGTSIHCLLLHFTDGEIKALGIKQLALPVGGQWRNQNEEALFLIQDGWILLVGLSVAVGPIVKEEGSAILSLWPVV